MEYRPDNLPSPWRQTNQPSMTASSISFLPIILYNTNKISADGIGLSESHQKVVRRDLLDLF